jgi:hypothetical protein
MPNPKFMQLEELQELVLQQHSELPPSQLVAVFLRAAKLRPGLSQQQQATVLVPVWDRLRDELNACKVGWGRGWGSCWQWGLLWVCRLSTVPLMGLLLCHALETARRVPPARRTITGGSIRSSALCRAA